MKRLFTPEGEAALLVTMQRRPLLAFDFDGTLAPIVARPGDARVPAPVAHRLQRLAGRLPVAVVSGRRVHDVRPRLLFTPWRIVGNHGAEDEAEPDAPVVDLTPARAQLEASAAALRAAGVVVEDKGLSLALHYRLASDRDAAQRAIADVVNALPPSLAVFGGKMVVNIVAAQARDKADAVAALVAASGADAAVFVGDDVNDEPVFARPEPSWFTVRVGQDDPSSQARYFLDGPADLPRLLDRMLESLPGGMSDTLDSL
ncbi:MAG TPA: trehalose-phosphatase [Ideonella sp.]|uniref:trehalose-phosphatase n=1 Tax=Ideonella sp. TaxID=1929293 RepID=UPI002E2F7932|nr:trehalose-phosphatase [Ideonella sp.]HEX5687914.1 trehalose-phosphatase [Ideonella sp.]